MTIVPGDTTFANRRIVQPAEPKAREVLFELRKGVERARFEILFHAAGQGCELQIFSNGHFMFSQRAQDRAGAEVIGAAHRADWEAKGYRQEP